jgi:nucleoid-associated protein YgaU
MQNQQSRVNALPNNAEVAELKGKIDASHATATTALTTCDLAAAETALADAEAQLAALEAKYGRPSGDTYTVVRGDSLWKIAAKRYANPYFWPLIYWANNSAIKDPDLIYPNQQFKIETGSASQQADAEKLARTRGAWSLFDGK